MLRLPNTYHKPQVSNCEKLSLIMFDLRLNLIKLREPISVEENRRNVTSTAPN